MIVINGLKDDNETRRLVYFICRIIVLPLSNVITWVDYAYKMGTQKQAMITGKNLEGQDNFEFWL